MNKNDFSVLISLYDKESPINFKLAIESILNQTLKPKEIVIVKDGVLTTELDNIIDIYTDVTDIPIKIVALPINGGLGNALKVGLIHCSYDLVARMDTDDICYPTRFERQIEYFATNPNVSVLGAGVKEFKNIPNDTDSYRRPPHRFSEILSFAKYRNPVNHPTVMFKKKDVLAGGSYLHMPYFEDFHLWARMISNGFVIENLDEDLLHFRIGNDMIGRRHGISYFGHELVFLKALKKMGYLSNIEFIISLLTKMPLRLLPKRILTLIYSKLLR